ncbi:hypothetical protein HU200_047754 [Digitaria exilis]|uniref:F-box domain-containing protein n=1 Tax=Digitaria exilis TaxID=1010633 RepID=A0A835EDL1_9POAL|nr:hypothetical protein HU200_047754 [Digitaria exilis]
MEDLGNRVRTAGMLCWPVGERKTPEACEGSRKGAAPRLSRPPARPARRAAAENLSAEEPAADGKAGAVPAPALPDDTVPTPSVDRRKRALSPPRGSDSDSPRHKRTRPMPEEAERAADGKDNEAVPALALPDDMLLEVFKRLPPPRDVVRCAAVCRRWRRAIAGAEAACLPTPPRHFGFFLNYDPSPLPPFVRTAGVALGVGALPVPPARRAFIVDSRGRRLLMRELGPGSIPDLRLLVCSPLDMTCVRLPSPYIAGHRVACSVLVPGEGASFRVVVVLFGSDPNHFEVLVYSSSSSSWEAATGPINRDVAVRRGPSVVIGDVVYKLQGEDKRILVVDALNMKLSAMPLPNTGTLLYVGNHWIGKTGDGRLCFFAMREQLTLVKWVLEAPGKWAEQRPVNLRSLMHPALVGDLAQTKLSAKMSDQLRGCKLVSFAAFCEATGTLFFIMADWVVALDPRTGWLQRLWHNPDESRPLGDVYPCEMLQWPPLKDLGEAHAAGGVC